MSGVAKSGTKKEIDFLGGDKWMFIEDWLPNTVKAALKFGRGMNLMEVHVAKMVRKGITPADIGVALVEGGEIRFVI